MIIRKAGVIILLGASALLSACFPVALHRNEAPDIWRHVADTSRTRDIIVLVLAISEEYRAGHWATLGGSSGTSRNIQSPIFVSQRELKDLSAKLSRYSLDMVFIGYFGGWVEKSDERIVGVCVMWPDGQFLALEDPKADQWQRETRGSMSMLWQKHLIEALSAAKMLATSVPQGACPNVWGKLNWDYAMRERVIAYLKQVAVEFAPK